MNAASLFRALLGAVVGYSCAMALPHAASASGPPVAVELALRQNTGDGCTTCGCQLKGTVAPDRERRWWMTFGEVVPDPANGWASRGPAAFTYCGAGEFKSISEQFLSVRGAPYLIVEVRVANSGKAAPSGRISVNWTLSELDRFTWRGKARYEKSTREMAWDSDKVLDAAIPVFFEEAAQRSRLGVFEVMASIHAEALGSELVQYGEIGVVSDFPGAWVMLDGAQAARYGGAAPMVLSPVPAGDHTVALRDFSARQVEQVARVRPGELTVVTLNLLDRLVRDEETGLAWLGDNPQGFEELWRDRDGAVMVRVPAGRFRMGSDDPGSEPDAAPPHEVYLDTYFIDKTEVTWRQFRSFAQATGASVPPAPEWGRPDGYALSNVTWAEADAYCSWVGGRLPTEAEWEKAARGTDSRTYTWGNDWDPSRCNSISGGMHQPEPVGSFPGCASPYGVLDMSGSHWQWVLDYYDENYYGVSPERNPKGPDTGRLRVKRGGYWMDHPQQLTVSRRAKSDPDWRNFSHGFRCVVESGEVPK